MMSNSTQESSMDNLEEQSVIETAMSPNEDICTPKTAEFLRTQFIHRRPSIIKEGDNIHSDLKKALDLRKDDSMRLIVSLDKVNSKLDGYRYFCVIVTIGKLGTKEFLILGVDVVSDNATIGLVVPICQDMSVALDGDSGFKLKNKEGEKLFKPTSVRALWCIVQLLNRACSLAQTHNYYIGGLSHDWIDVYSNKITSNRAQIAEWNRMIDADAKANSSLAPHSAIGEYVMGRQIDDIARNKDEITRHLKEIMPLLDMDVVSVVELRERLQEKISFPVKEYRSYVEDEIYRICGQMQCASEILPYLYLGSRYNAANLEELCSNKITHILNVTRESENFFHEQFVYRNVRVFDIEDTNLLKFFNENYEFINEAKSQNGACLVHCQQGISRSATVVIAYLMKELNLSRDDALEYVKQKRDCVNPNAGFMLQMKTYEGILKAKREFISNMSNEQQLTRKKNISSVPNESLSSEQHKSSLSSDQIPDHPHSHYTPAPQSSKNLSESLAPNDYLNKAERVIQFPNTPNKVDNEDFVLMYRKQNYDADTIDSVFDVNREVDKNDQNESARRSTQVKDDSSWIKTVDNDKSSGVESDGLLTNADLRFSESDLNRDVDMRFENDENIDKKSLPSVKTLLTKYNKTE